MATIILSNLSLFKKNFTGRFLGKFLGKWTLNTPSHLAYVATLPCETVMSANKPLTINYNSTQLNRELWTQVSGPLSPHRNYIYYHKRSLYDIITSADQGVSVHTKCVVVSYITDLRCNEDPLWKIRSSETEYTVSTRCREYLISLMSHHYARSQFDFCLRLRCCAVSVV